MRFANAVLQYLKENDVKHIFGIPAGNISGLYDAMNDFNFDHIVAKNEAGAAYMATRYANVTGNLGVCIGAGGVGVNNMINGIADAMRSKAPVLVITGYVNRWQAGKGAIQELDTQEILRPITKYSKTILDENIVLDELKAAIELAYTVPMGPVHISIPLDIQMMECNTTLPSKVVIDRTNISFDEKLVKEACQVIENEENGIIFVGKGCRKFGDLISELSNHLQWPIISTPEGKGVVSSDHPFHLGAYGFASTDVSTEYINDAKNTCILVLGSSLGESATCNFNASLVNGKKSIHVDWDKKELGKVFETDINICSDIKDVITYIMQNTAKRVDRAFIKPALNKETSYTCTGISTKEVMEKLPSVMPKDTYYITDMGEFMSFAFKYLPIPEGSNIEMNLGYAAMGSAIGGAVGVQLAYPKRPVAVIVGDGSFFMNGNEILTAKEYNLPIIYIVINNSMLGFVEHGHEILFGRVLKEFKQERINISEVVKACGIKSIQINDITELDQINSFIKNSNGPKVIEIITDGSEPSPNGDRLKSLQNKR